MPRGHRESPAARATRWYVSAGEAGSRKAGRYAWWARANVRRRTRVLVVPPKQSTNGGKKEEQRNEEVLVERAEKRIMQEHEEWQEGGNRMHSAASRQAEQADIESKCRRVRGSPEPRSAHVRTPSTNATNQVFSSAPAVTGRNQTARGGAGAGGREQNNAAGRHSRGHAASRRKQATRST